MDIIKTHECIRLTMKEDNRNQKDIRYNCKECKLSSNFSKDKGEIDKTSRINGAKINKEAKINMEVKINMGAKIKIIILMRNIKEKLISLTKTSRN